MIKRKSTGNPEKKSVVKTMAADRPLNQLIVGHSSLLLPGLDILNVRARATSPRIAAPNCHSSWPPCPISSSKLIDLFYANEKLGQVPSSMNSTVVICCGNVDLLWKCGSQPQMRNIDKFIQGINRNARYEGCSFVCAWWKPECRAAGARPVQDMNFCTAQSSDMLEDGHKGGTASRFPLQHQP